MLCPLSMLSLPGLEGCCLRDITDVSIIEHGAVQVLLPEKKCDFHIDALTINGELSYHTKSLKIRKCTAIVMISGLRGRGVLLRVPSGEVIYSPTTTPPDGTRRGKKMQVRTRTWSHKCKKELNKDHCHIYQCPFTAKLDCSLTKTFAM